MTDMGGAPGGAGADFATRFNEALTRSAPREGGRWTDRAVSAAARAKGYKLSATYVRQLRVGLRTNPSIATIEALSEILGVSPMWFLEGTEDVQSDATDDVVEALEILRDAGAEAVLARGRGRIPESTLERIAAAIRDAGDASDLPETE